MRGWIQVTIFVVFFSNTLFAQTEFSTGTPLFPPVSSWYEAAVDKSQIELMRSIDQPKDQPYQFALPVMVSLKPSNAGFIIRKGGETVWVIPVSSKGALSLNAILKPFRLPEGAYVYIYDENHEVIRGAFTSQSGTGILPTLPVPGDRMVIECHFPGNEIPDNAIGVSQIAHDFAGYFRLASSKDIYYGRAGGCEVDLNCSTNQKYLLSSRSVCRLLVAGTELCSGTLINNTGKDYKAYVLTAQHCVENAGNASSTIFVFNYVSPWCDGSDNSRQHSISGSLLRATNQDIDFSLVELSSFPSLVLKPYLSGWDITSTPPGSTYSVHHPEGDVMKISIDDNPPVTSSYPVSGYVSYGFWKILRWDLGTTEAGSSGGGLFDQNSNLRGTLTGGAATCVNPENDYYAKLSRMFSISTVPASNLKSWLDPLSTGATVVSGRDPYAWNLSRSDTLRNIPVNDPGQTDIYTLPGYGYSTGINSDSLIRYAEYIPFVGVGEIAWINLNIANTSWINTADSVRVYLWRGGATPGTAIASRLIKLQEVRDNFDLEVDFGRTIAVSGSFYVGYRVYYKATLSSPQVQFAVRHSQPYSQPSLNTAWFHDGTAWRPFTQHPSFPMAVSLYMNVIMIENSILNDINNPAAQGMESLVFPNPFSRSISFSISDTARLTTLTIYDNRGSVVSATRYNNISPGILTIELPSLPSGIYHYSLKNDSDIQSGTIIKIETD
ncbi:MAG TPA: trypsin-like peptidase domain-containing protein [Bacteroidales bacterium]|nr:trypsin-like peptidase domain-containing protein [Bacteroidales bacterium]